MSTKLPHRTGGESLAINSDKTDVIQYKNRQLVVQEVLQCKSKELNDYRKTQFRSLHSRGVNLGPMISVRPC